MATYPVSLRSIFQIIDLVNLDPQLTRLEQAKELVDIGFKFFMCSDVIEQLGTGNLDILCRENPVAPNSDQFSSSSS